MKVFWAIIFLCSALFLNAQDCQSSLKLNESDCEKRFDTLRKLCINMLESKTSIKYIDSKNAFYKKLHLDNGEDFGNPQITDDMEQIMEWIRINIHKTDFISFEDAVKEKDNYQRLSDLVTQENFSYYKYQNEVAISCGDDVINRLYREMLYEYGSYFHL
jgi:hypothetical protein